MRAVTNREARMSTYEDCRFFFLRPTFPARRRCPGVRGQFPSALGKEETAFLAMMRYAFSFVVGKKLWGTSGRRRCVSDGFSAGRLFVPSQLDGSSGWLVGSGLDDRGPACY